MRSKYNARKFKCPEGMTWQSVAEYKRYLVLREMQNRGEIQYLERQVPYELYPKRKGFRVIKYVADFLYFKNGSVVVEDVKGFKTDVYLLKKRMMLEIYGIEIHEVSVR